MRTIGRHALCSSAAHYDSLVQCLGLRPSGPTRRDLFTSRPCPGISDRAHESFYWSRMGGMWISGDFQWKSQVFLPCLLPMRGPSMFCYDLFFWQPACSIFLACVFMSYVWFLLKQQKTAQGWGFLCGLFFFFSF